MTINQKITDIINAYVYGLINIVGLNLPRMQFELISI